MRIKMMFSQDEGQEIQSLTRLMSERIGFSVTLNGLLQKWTDFILHCEKGYTDCVDEYTNDLDSRILIQEIIDKVSPAVAEKLGSYITELDRRFENATLPISTPLLMLSNPPKPIEIMLYLRIPKKIGAELESDLKASGIRT